MEGLEDMWGSLRPGTGDAAVKSDLIEHTVRLLHQKAISVHLWCSEYGGLFNRLVEEALPDAGTHAGFQQLWELAEQQLGECPGCVVAYHRAQAR